MIPAVIWQGGMVGRRFGGLSAPQRGEAKGGTSCHGTTPLTHILALGGEQVRVLEWPGPSPTLVAWPRLGGTAEYFGMLAASVPFRILAELYPVVHADSLGLRKPSIVLMDQIRACDLSRIRARIGQLDSQGADRVRTAFRTVFAVE